VGHKRRDEDQPRLQSQFDFCSLRSHRERVFQEPGQFSGTPAARGHSQNVLSHAEVEPICCTVGGCQGRWPSLANQRTTKPWESMARNVCCTNKPNNVLIAFFTKMNSGRK
jgi:hypothetical protein